MPTPGTVALSVRIPQQSGTGASVGGGGSAELMEGAGIVWYT